MNLRRVMLMNIVLYIATLLVASIVLALKDIPLHFSTPPTGHQIFVAMVTGIVLTILGAWWYFRTEVANFRQGFLFGLIAILVGFGMDMVMSIGILISGRNPVSFLQSSYTYWFFGVMLLSVLLLTSVVGWGMGQVTRRTIS